VDEDGNGRDVLPWPALQPVAAPDPHREAARKLASAVILQALKDAHNDRTHPVRREQARAWLVAPSRLRDFWLALAAVPADRLPAARVRRRRRRTRNGHGRGADMHQDAQEGSEPRDSAGQLPSTSPGEG
jgi:hypothetical protein